MPIDPNKLAQLNALATGGTSGLQAWQQADQQAQAAKASAVSQAAGFASGTSYNTSPELQAQLGQIADKAAAPGANATASGLAAEPGLDAMGQSAYDTYMGRANQSMQSRLAAEKAKLDLQRQADQVDQQSKLNEMALERQKLDAQSAYQLGQLDVDRMKLALSPEQVTGDAMKNQAAAVNKAQTQAGISAGGSGLLGAAQDMIGKAKEHADEQKRLADQSVAEIESRNAELAKTGDLKDSDTEYLNQLKENQARANDTAGKFAAIPAAQQRIGDMQQRASGLADQSAATAQLASVDLPRFQYNTAVQRGMDPNAAAAKYLVNEDQTIYQKELQKYNQDALGDTLEARQGLLQQRLAAQQQKAEADDAGKRIGWQPKDLIDLSNKTNLAIGDIADRVTSDAWKKVDEMAKNAGKKLDEADAAALGDSSLAGTQFNEDTFKAWLMANPDLDQQTRMLAYNRYRPMFSLTPNENNVGSNQ